MIHHNIRHFHLITHHTCFRSPEEAADYVRTLQALLRAVGSSDGNMEQVGPLTDVVGKSL